MNEPAWLSVPLLLAIQARQIELFGGEGGVRDVTTLEAAAALPQSRFAFGERDLAALAAASAFHLARGNPFVAGNNRLALAAVLVFLALNGVEFRAPLAEAAVVFLALTAGEIGEELLTLWIRRHAGAGGAALFA